MVKTKWNSHIIGDEGMSKCKEKFKMLKHDLKSWNTQVFRNIYTTKIDVIAQIGKLDIKDAYQRLSEEVEGKEFDSLVISRKLTAKLNLS